MDLPGRDPPKHSLIINKAFGTSCFASSRISINEFIFLESLGVINVYAFPVEIFVKFKIFI